MTALFDVGGAFGGAFALFMVFAALELAFKIWMFVDALQRPAERYPSPDQRTLWQIGLGVGLVLNFIGLVIAIVYLVLVYLPGRGAPRSTAVPTGPACRHCGSTLNPAAAFCHVCGTPATTPQQETR